MQSVECWTLAVPSEGKVLKMGRMGVSIPTDSDGTEREYLHPIIMCTNNSVYTIVHKFVYIPLICSLLQVL